jgi:hypothetical protein
MEGKSMAHGMKLKDGRIITVLEMKDVLETIEEYAGQEPRRYIEDWLADIEQDKLNFDAQEKDYESRMEQQGDHYRGVLNDIREEGEALEEMLFEGRLNRSRMQGAVRRILNRINREL